MIKEVTMDAKHVSSIPSSNTNFLERAAWYRASKVPRFVMKPTEVIDLNLVRK